MSTILFRPVGSQFSIIGILESETDATYTVSSARICVTRIQGESVDLEFYPYDPLLMDSTQEFFKSAVLSRASVVPDKLENLYFVHRTGIQLADAHAALSELASV